MNCEFFWSLVGLYQKQIWKNFEENFEKINRGDPFLKNLPWGTKGKNLEKKICKKIFFNKTVLGYMFYIIEFFFGKFWKKKKMKKKSLRFFPLVPQGRFFQVRVPPIDFLKIFFRIFSDLFLIKSHMRLKKNHNSQFNL